MIKHLRTCDVCNKEMRIAHITLRVNESTQFDCCVSCANKNLRRRMERMACHQDRLNLANLLLRYK